MRENLRFKSEYLERQICKRLLKSEPSIVKLIENKSDLPKLSTCTLSEPSIVKSIENQSEHLSKLTLYQLLKKRATRRSRRDRDRAEFHCYFWEVSTRRVACWRNLSSKRFQRLRYRSLQSCIAVLIRWENLIMHDINVITNAIQR